MGRRRCVVTVLKTAASKAGPAGSSGVQHLHLLPIADDADEDVYDFGIGGCRVAAAAAADSEPERVAGAAQEQGQDPLGHPSASQCGQLTRLVVTISLPSRSHTAASTDQASHLRQRPEHPERAEVAPPR